jgi:hypothetical protein
LIWNLQVTGPKGTNWKNLLAYQTSELLKLHNHALGFNTQAHGKILLHNRTLPRWSKLAGGKVGPEEGNK